MTTYRPDIDGLRAAAILSVLFFHLDISLIKGGFLGVDVFFVISGFLITRIIHDELKAGEFSLAGFYERRIRRILPALLAVCASCLAFFWFVFLPGDYIELNQSAAAALLFVSNIFFWRRTGYFATDVDEKPLLHTWSLGIEEQFYIVLPLLLMLAFRFRSSSCVWIVAAGALVSLALAEYGVRNFGNAAFYLLPFRFWELAVGALLALTNPPPLKFRQADNLLTLLGLLLILASVLSLSEESGVPGIAALVPCLGAALVLYAGGRASLSRWTFAFAPAVFVGKISYSLYLWHWPVIAFANYMSGDPYDGWGRAYMLAASFVLATLSWKFIETPFRNRDFLSRRAVFRLAGAAMASLCVVAALGVAMQGYQNRFSERVRQLEASMGQDEPLFVHEICVPEAGKEFHEGKRKCHLGDLDTRHTGAVLWGDSHASAYGPVISEFLKWNHIRGIMETKSSCPGFAGSAEWDSKEYAGCHKFNQKVLAAILADPKIRHVFIAGRWAPVAVKFAEDPVEAEARFLAALEDTRNILEAAGRKVFFLGPVPEPGFDVPRCLLRQAQFGEKAVPCTPPDLGTFKAENALVLSAFGKLKPQARVFLPHEVICAGGVCRIAQGDKAVFFDDDHLSRSGSLSLLEAMKAQFGGQLQGR